MKIFYTLLFIAFSFSCFGQSKGDVLDCLNLIFNHHEFQPAYCNKSLPRNLDLVIIGRLPGFNRTRQALLEQHVQSLTQSDFLDSRQSVLVTREDDLESMGIPEEAGLSLGVTGDATTLKFRLSTTVISETIAYSWSYKLSKINEVWEIVGASVDKQKAVIRNHN